MKRYKPPVRKDKKIFARTASKVKAINLYPSIMRGGTRL